MRCDRVTPENGIAWTYQKCFCYTHFDCIKQNGNYVTRILSVLNKMKTTLHCHRGAPENASARAGSCMDWVLATRCTTSLLDIVMNLWILFLNIIHNVCDIVRIFHIPSRLPANIYVCTYIYIHAFTYIYICIYVYIYTFYICLYIHIHIYVYSYIIYICMYVYTYLYVHIYTHTQVYIYVYIYIYMHIYTVVYMQPLSFFGGSFKFCVSLCVSRYAFFLVWYVDCCIFKYGPVISWFACVSLCVSLCVSRTLMGPKARLMSFVTREIHATPFIHAFNKVPHARNCTGASLLRGAHTATGGM